MACVCYTAPVPRASSLGIAVVVATLLPACDDQMPPESSPQATLYTPEIPVRSSASVVASNPASIGTPIPAPAEVRRISFTTGNSFRDSALKALSTEQLDALDQIFLGRFDVHALVPPGTVIQTWLRGSRVVAGEVGLADGRRVRAAYFGGSATSLPGFYDQAGLSLASELLGRPISLSRITSRFGQRLHPKSATMKEHHGVDYGAPEGTPIFSIGDGIIVTRATDSAAGNHIKIRHPNGYESWYLHMQRFASENAKGSSVKQGDVIGYVGTTGASTGPHLHYELHRSGFALDPLKRLPLPQTALGPLSQPEHKRNLELLP